MNYLGLKAWSNGNQGTHYAIFYSLMFFIPSAIIGHKLKENFGSKPGKIFSSITVVIIIITMFLFMSII